MVSMEKITEQYGNDPGRLMDILLTVQQHHGYISSGAVAVIARQCGLSKVDVEQTLTFYHFFRTKPTGEYIVHLNNSAVSIMCGCLKVAEAFKRETGCAFGSVSADGLASLDYTSCIGMSDQEPAALINGTVFPRLNGEKVKRIAAGMRQRKSVQDIAADYGEPVTGSDGTGSILVHNNILKKGAVIFAGFESGAALRRCVTLTPEQVTAEIKKSNLRGRGGAGFPTGLKWEFCQKAPEKPHYILCNADEGEPGTFKDRAIVTVVPHLLFEGMAVAGYAVGACRGYLYLRYEYQYLVPYLEKILADLREKNILGSNICGKQGFDFDIRIQMGAGAYVCGEESALIESMEGKRGEPRIRPPFPVEKGYRNKPSVINNVETLCAAARILEKGAAWFSSMGTTQSAGTKVLSVSGDCRKPGIYEVEWGIRVVDMLQMAGASDVQAVQIGGPSGICLNPQQLDRQICFGDCATGGSFIVIGNQRNLLSIVKNFVDFFAEETCGSCVPCRAGTLFLQHALNKILAGKGRPGDIDRLLELGAVMKTTNRCGLGQTAAAPVVSTIEHFRHLYEAALSAQSGDMKSFDMHAATAESNAFVKRAGTFFKEYA